MHSKLGSAILALALLLAPIGCLRAASTELIEAMAAWLQTDPSPSETAEVPGLGTLSGDTRLQRDFVLPAGTTYGSPPQDRIATGTQLVDIPPEAIQALTDDSQLTPLLNALLTTPEEVEADPSYDIRITSVDTRAFPDVEVKFHIMPKDISTPTFDPERFRAADFQLVEEVLEEERAVTEFLSDPPVEACGRTPMVVAIAVDSSCSVQGVIADLKAKAMLFAEELLDPSKPHEPEDALSFYSFDGRGKFRAPPLENVQDSDPATPAYFSVGAGSTGVLESFEAVDVDRPCLGSPIFESMMEELGWLVAYQPDLDLRRVLVTFADFRDTDGNAAKREIIAAMEANTSVEVVGLGFGRVSKDRVQEVFDYDEATGSFRRGGFIQNGSADTQKALDAIYTGLGTNYCLRYRTPFPNRINEIAELKLALTDPESGTVSRAQARYALPLVVPEDSADVRLFLPLTYAQYKAASQGGGSGTTVRLTPRFVPDPDLPPGTGLERPLPGTMELPGSVVVDDPDLGLGLWLREAELGPGWRQLFHVPTEFVRVDPEDTGAPRLLDVSRFELDVILRTPGSLGDGDPYPGMPVLTVQDRTPPHLFVRLSPSDGRVPLELRIREGLFDQSPLPLADGIPVPPGGRLDSAAVSPPGNGLKRAQASYRWLGSDGTPLAGVLTGQQWSSLPPGSSPGEEISALADPPGTPVGRRIFQPPDFVEGGLEVEAGVRVRVEVLARDNFALLETLPRSGTPEAQAFLAPEPDAPEGPLHARFDLARPEAQGREAAAPFLPLVPVEDLRADPSRPGVAWWIASADDRDRFAFQAGIEFFQYPQDDQTVMLDLAREGVVTPPFPVRTFEVHAQDGQGNVTRVTLPIFVHPAGFRPRLIDAESRRVEER